MERRWSFDAGSLGLRQGDLTLARVDAVVNAANSGLMGGGGVDGAIHRAAGPKLLEACKDIIKKIGRLPAGQAVITPGFDLAARHVIHTVGPVWRGGERDEEALLASAYAQSLALARANGLATVAFPAVSCGAYGYPVELAAPVALGAMRRGVEQGLVREAWLYLYSADAFNLWLGLAKQALGEAHG